MGVDAADGLVPAQQPADHHDGGADDGDAGPVHPQAGESPESQRGVGRGEDRQRQDVLEPLAAHPIRIA